MTTNQPARPVHTHAFQHVFSIEDWQCACGAHVFDEDMPREQPPAA